MYRCSVCRKAGERGKPMLRHVVYKAPAKPGQSGHDVAGELPVCPACKKQLDDGMSMIELLRRLFPPPQPRVPEPPPIAVPDPETYRSPDHRPARVV